MATKKDYWVEDEPAKVYIDKRLLPVTPRTLTISQSSNNEAGNLADGNRITRTKKMAPQKIVFEFLLPFYEELNIVFPDTWHERKYFTDEFWYKEEDLEYYTISVIYPNGEFFNTNAMLDTWDYSQDAEHGSDWNFTLTFTEAAPKANIESQYILENPYVRVGGRDYTRVS